MRCGTAKRWISATLDGELDDQRQQALTAHLASCRRCRAFAVRLSSLDETLDSSRVEDPRWGFADRVMARIDDVGPSTVPVTSLLPAWFRVLRPAPIGVGAAAFCAGAALVMVANGQAQTETWQRGDVVAALAEDYLGIESQPMLGDELGAILPESEE